MRVDSLFFIQSSVVKVWEEWVDGVVEPKNVMEIGCMPVCVEQSWTLACLKAEFPLLFNEIKIFGWNIAETLDDLWFCILIAECRRVLFSKVG